MSGKREGKKGSKLFCGDLLNWVRFFVAPLTLLMLWELATRIGFLDARYIAPPSEIIKALGRLLSSGGGVGSTLYMRESFISNTIGTCGRMFRAYCFSSILGISLGLIIGWSQTLEVYFRPVLELLRPIPGITLLPLTLLWFGPGDNSKIPVVIFATFFPIFIHTIGGVHNLEPGLIKVARVMEIKGFNFFRKIVLPSALPHIFTGLRLSAAYGFTSTVATEVLSGTEGLGFVIVDFQRSFQVPAMYASLLVIGVLGFTLNFCVERVRDIVLGYNHEQT